MDRTLQKGLHRPPELAPKSVRGGRGIPGAGEDCLSPQGEFRSSGHRHPAQLSRLHRRRDFQKALRSGKTTCWTAGVT